MILKDKMRGKKPEVRGRPQKDRKRCKEVQERVDKLKMKQYDISYIILKGKLKGEK